MVSSEIPIIMRSTGLTLGGISMGGLLKVFPRRIECRPNRVGRFLAGTDDPLVHTEPTVRMLCARLVPPWMNTALTLVSDDGRRFTLGEPGWHRASLRRDLATAGFRVVEERTWFGIGNRWAAG